MTKQRIKLAVTEDALCSYFRIDSKKVTHFELVEMNYVFAYAHKNIDSDLIEEVLAEIKRLQKIAKLSGRSKRRRLYQLYFHCKSTTIKECGRYDTTTMKLPKRINKPNYY